MLAAIFRLFVVVLIFAALAVLFVYAFVAALIITPFLLLLFYVLGRKGIVRWQVVRPGNGRPGPRGPQQGPVIDHDPNDLPPSSRS
jgi:hypothetical protein